MSYTPVIPSTRVVRFGVFELALDSGDLRKNGREVRLVGQPMQILCLLVERRGDVVTREELRRALWSDDTFVDFDVSLSSAVKKLRDALGDSADNPRFVQTLPRRGYRFVAPVEEVNGTAPVIAPRAPTHPTIIAVAFAIAIGVFLAGWLWEPKARTESPAPKPAAIRSIAVLPFDNLTGDASQEYLVDGITDGLTTELAEVRGLRVISRTSVMRYRRTTKRLPDIARDLNVDAIVEGSIMRTGQQVQISAQLIDASTDRHLWAHKYSGSVGDVITAEATFAQSIAMALGVQVVAQRPAPRMNPEAFDSYLRGTYAAGRQNVEGFKNALTYFRDAIAKQPDCALCYASLAQTQLQLVFGSQPPVDVMPKAEEAARKAIELDPSVALAHRVLGNVLNLYYWRWDDGDRELHLARDLDPNSVETRRSIATSLIRSGRFDEAMAELDKMRAVDPVSMQTQLDAAMAFRAAGQYDRAIAMIQRALQLDPSIPRVHYQLGVTYVAMHRLNDAITEVETADRLGGNARFRSYLGYLYAAAGRIDDARSVLHELEERSHKQYVSAFGPALIHDALGDGADAINAFERAYQEHAVELAQLNQYPSFRTIASDPRYQLVIQRVQRPPRQPLTADLTR